MRGQRGLSEPGGFIEPTQAQVQIDALCQQVGIRGVVPEKARALLERRLKFCHPRFQCSAFEK